MLTLLRTLLIVLVVATPLRAQLPPSLDEHERVLLPLFITAQDGIPGARGSVWVTRLAISNHGDAPVSVQEIDPQPGGCGGIMCLPAARISAGATIYPTLYTTGPHATQGAFVYVERAHLADVSIALRVQDVSRESLTWGTSLNTVRESEARTSTVNLIDIPAGSDFRYLLRVYDIFPRTEFRAVPRRVVVKVYETNRFQNAPHPTITGDRLLAEFVRSLNLGPALWTAPGYFQEDLDTIAALSRTGRTRVEVTPLSTDLRFWAFVSVTNNETQHVTVVEPQ